MEPTAFGLAYVDTILESMRFETDGDLYGHPTRQVSFDWSIHSAQRIRRKVRELFYYETQDTLRRIREEKNHGDGHVYGDRVRAIHYGLIEEDPLTTVAKGLLVADVVVLQDWLYRSVASEDQFGSREDLRSIAVKVAYEMKRLRPLIEKGAVYLVPWLPHCEPDRLAGLVELQQGPAATVDKSAILSLQIGTALCQVLGGFPFTTWAPAHRSSVEIIRNSVFASAGSVEEWKLRLRDIGQELCKDEKLPYLAKVTPDQILGVCADYKGFKLQLRKHFRDALQADTNEDYLRLLEEDLSAMHVSLQQARKAIKVKAANLMISTGATLTAIGLAAVTAKPIEVIGLQVGRPAMLAAATAVQIANWIDKRFGGTQKSDPFIGGLLRLETIAEK